MRKILFSLILVAFGSFLRAQDPVFSQFFASGIQLNPAFAGSAFAPRFGLQYRHQWPGISNAFKTYSVNYEQSLPNLNSGIGFVAMGDNAGSGIYKTNRFGLVYAYKLEVNERLFIKFGMEAGLHQTSLDWDKLTFPDQLDVISGPSIPTDETRPEITSRSAFDASTGILIYGEKFYGGLSLKHLNTPNTTILPLNNRPSAGSGLPMRLSLHGGAEFTIQEGNNLRPRSFWSPNFLFESQGAFRQLNVGAYAGIGPMFGGLWFRHTFGNADATVLLVGLKQGVFKLGLSYDTTVSGLTGRTGGSYELSLGILLDQDEYAQKKHRRGQLNDCLHMFR
jgi:type IX secretion system PorP/SprF family membrane protein